MKAFLKVLVTVCFGLLVFFDMGAVYLSLYAIISAIISFSSAADSNSLVVGLMQLILGLGLAVIIVMPHVLFVRFFRREKFAIASLIALAGILVMGIYGALFFLGGHY